MLETPLEEVCWDEAPSQLTIYGILLAKTPAFWNHQFFIVESNYQKMPMKIALLQGYGLLFCKYHDGAMLPKSKKQGSLWVCVFTKDLFIY